MSPKLEHWFQEYEAYHRHPVNRLTHKIAIPAIVFHILAMLDWIGIIPLGRLPGLAEPYHLSMGHLFFLAVVLWYGTLSPRLALVAFFVFLPVFPVAAFTPYWVVIVIAMVAWGIQLAGHAVWEKRSPAFVTNLVQALIGPLFFIALATGDWRAQEQFKTVAP